MSDQHPKPVNRSRVVVVESVYHQPIDGAPIITESKYVRVLDSDEQPYGPRRIKVHGDWTQLKTGWLTTYSLVTLSNEEGRHLQVIPTTQQSESIRSRIIDIAILDEFGKYIVIGHVNPGESYRGTPPRGATLYARCLHHPAKITYTAFPI